VALGTADEANAATTTYTSNGKVQTVTDGENNKTTYVYDSHDRLSQTRYPSATKGAGTSNSSDYEQPTYENTAGGTRTSGTVTAFRNRAAESIGFTLDALGRLTAKDLPGSEPDVTYTYDLLGRLTGASQTGNSLSFTYDTLGRNLTQVGPQGTVTSTWDIAGRLRLSNKARKRLACSAAEELSSSPRALAYRIGKECAVDRLLLAAKWEDARSLAQWTPPRLPIGGGQLIARGLKEGPIVAQTLRLIEDRWVEAGFPTGDAFQRIVDAELGAAA